MLRAVVAVILVVTALAVPARAASEGANAAQPRIDARAWYLVGEDGAVLAQSSSRRPRAIASITKLMTAVVALERARPSELVRVSSNAAGIGEATVYLRDGELLRVGDLLRGMLVRSANDAALALALHVGRGSTGRFVSYMNGKARELGLRDTRFQNPHGLDAAGHASSARDVTTLLRYALGIPFIRDALGRTSVSLPGGRSFPTTDDLLAGWPPLVGGKTGHTRAAGWSQTAAASGRGATVYGTVLGTDSRKARNDELRELLTYGLGRYRRIEAISAARIYAEAATGYGRPRLELVAPRSIVRTLRKGMALVERVIAPAAVGLPVRKGEVLGRVEVYEGNRLVAFSGLVAATSVEAPGLLGKTRWYVTRTAENVWELVT